MSDDLSLCGLSCLLSPLASTDCGSILNTTCLCPDQFYNSLVSTCVRSNCTIAEQLSVEIITSRSCNVPVIDRSGQIGILQGLLTPIQDVLFFLRIASRVLRIAPWGADDVTIVIAWVFQNVFLGGGIVASRLGIGRDVWGLDESRIVAIIQLFLAFEILYTVTLGLIKMSICFLYLRLFPDKGFRRYLWATQIFNVVLIATFLIVDFAQCRPLSWFWNRLRADATETGSCIDINAMSWAHAIINIVLDMWILALPMTQILRLQMTLGKKLRVLSMFALGSFLTLISCIRLKSLVTFAKTQNPTQDFFDIAVWSAIELTTGVVVACLPPSRQVLIRYGPNLRTMVSEYASKLSSTRTDWTVQSSSNRRSHAGDFKGTATISSTTTTTTTKIWTNNNNNNNNKPPRPRTLQLRMSDEISMTDFPRVRDYDTRRASEPEFSDLSRTDSLASSYRAPSASINDEAADHRKSEDAQRETAAPTPDVDPTPRQRPWRPMSYPPAAVVDHLRW